MPNKNYLIGMACPKCGSAEKFHIRAMAYFEVTDDGADYGRDVDWEDGDYCYCCECQFDGCVKDFKTKETCDSLQASAPPA